MNQQEYFPWVWPSARASESARSGTTTRWTWLLISLAQNHPFIDGNKRTAFAVTYTFLAINGAQLTADADKTYAFISGLHESGTFRFDKLVPWLRRHAKTSP